MVLQREQSPTEAGGLAKPTLSCFPAHSATPLAPSTRDGAPADCVPGQAHRVDSSPRAVEGYNSLNDGTFLACRQSQEQDCWPSHGLSDLPGLPPGPSQPEIHCRVAPFDARFLRVRLEFCGIETDLSPNCNLTVTWLLPDCYLSMV